MKYATIAFSNLLHVNFVVWSYDLWKSQHFLKLKNTSVEISSFIDNPYSTYMPYVHVVYSLNLFYCINIQMVWTKVPKTYEALTKYKNLQL